MKTWEKYITRKTKIEKYILFVNVKFSIIFHFEHGAFRFHSLNSGSCKIFEDFGSMKVHSCIFNPQRDSLHFMVFIEIKTTTLQNKTKKNIQITLVNYHMHQLQWNLIKPWYLSGGSVQCDPVKLAVSYRAFWPRTHYFGMKHNPFYSQNYSTRTEIFANWHQINANNTVSNDQKDSGSVRWMTPVKDVSRRKVDCSGVLYVKGDCLPFWASFIFPTHLQKHRQCKMAAPTFAFSYTCFSETQGDPESPTSWSFLHDTAMK